MRKKRNPQCRLDLACVPHKICKELSGMSEWLDAHPESIDWVFAELDTGATFDTGRMGLSAESVLRIALLRQYLQCDYDYLSFILMDSPSYRHFCRLESTQMPRKSSRLRLGAYCPRPPDTGQNRENRNRQSCSN